MAWSRRPTASALALTVVGAIACGSGDAPPSQSAMASVAENRMIEQLEAGVPIFGLTTGETTAESGAQMGQNRDADFVWYSLETGPFDMPTMEGYIAAMTEAAGTAGPHPIMLRIPPIRDDREAAVEHIRAGLASGAVAIAFPHIQSAEDVALAADAIGDRLWPTNPDGDVLSVIMIEDKEAVESVREIVGASGVSMVFPGPGDLANTYDGDAEAVEAAIQAILAACKEFDVPCMMTADDVVARLEQGFQSFIITDPDALAVGLAASGRSN